MKRRYIFAAALAVLALGCVKRTETAPAGMPPLNPPEIDTEIAARIRLAEADYIDLYATFGELMKDYNDHLFADEYHPQEVEKEFFQVFCVEDEFEITIPTDLPVYGRLEFIDIWCYGLDECCQEFDSQFLSHIEFFHPDFGYKIPLRSRVEVPSQPVIDRLEAVEENISRLDLRILDLSELFYHHLETLH